MPELTIPSVVPLAAEALEPAAGAPRAVAVLLPGSGPLDRNGDARRAPLGIQRQLAEGLAARGYASLRWDKRGVGQTAGDFRSTGFHDLVVDALAVVDRLAERDLPVVVIGHSEGSAISARILAERPAVAAGVLLSPYARPGIEVLRWQAEVLQPHLPAFVRGILRLLRTDLQQQSEKNRQRILATDGDVARVGGVRINARWHREFMAYDPSDDLAAATVPVLALGGAFDLQSPPEDTPRIAALRPAPTRADVLDGLSHILRRQPEPSIQAYRADMRRPIDERLVPLVADWLDGVLPQAATD